ncbi:MAG TPA: hypothetical protein VM493_06875, partial [Vicinamibacterales bacterium]|nr:hypothetical protein [Vicinamibacterales bacterium]
MKASLAIGTAIVVLGAAIINAGSPVTELASASGQSGPKAAPVPTFAKDVAPILYENCATCHRPGEIAPMSLLSYTDARKWAKAIRDEVSDGTMPPWHADPKHGKFANDRSLTAAEKDVLTNWANNGAPEGDPKDLPPLPKFAEGWQLGQPDTILQLPVDYKVPADGFVEYEYFEIPTNFTKDEWLQGLEVRPGNRAVVHHVIVSTRPPTPERRPSAISLARRRRDDEGARTEPLPRPAGAWGDDWRIRAGEQHDEVRRRAGDPDPRRLDPGGADALHHQRHRRHRPHQ